jgi:hypothetical protein
MAWLYGLGYKILSQFPTCPGSDLGAPCLLAFVADFDQHGHHPLLVFAALSYQPAGYCQPLKSSSATFRPHLQILLWWQNLWEIGGEGAGRREVRYVKQGENSRPHGCGLMAKLTQSISVSTVTQRLLKWRSGPDWAIYLKPRN